MEKKDFPKGTKPREIFVYGQSGLPAGCGI